MTKDVRETANSSWLNKTIDNWSGSIGGVLSSRQDTVETQTRLAT